ncbi:ribosomal RNA-processing protein 7 homolog A [Diabrotica virgifera virgifera]|uniref:Ribosomal RNA-processing protein 7 homolog A n=1 Tax=Diabrotica virgifera virgifera TaxID=50390 RepID=A0A6P7HDD7_DIAVI|nr:ribosomal RNA-processing protein 7 homolog A [Diabrotica virgifera virgifera]
MSSDISTFTVLPLVFSTECTSSHDVYIKEHSVRAVSEDKPPGQTLFMLNVPPTATEVGLRNAFSSVGNIRRIIFEKNTKEEGDGFKRAYIVFNKRDHLVRALQLKSLKPMSTDNEPIETGLNLWVKNYNNSICDRDVLRKKVEQFMADFDSQEKKDKTEENVDDEGWTVVTKGGRKPGLSRKESLANKLNEKVQKGAKKKELKNFYTFQIRESKKEQIALMRKSFEKDKEKVALMKQGRKFKPY